ncbi:tetratricopeptide repeat protein [Delftia sp. PS-11]|uniref:tetratricopeptide repeat protein n=1 Tax=Delftia sp. PS-11 TaxID=2767222 RepID=UPI002455BCF8|nr:hypothetical protein [Delftia sp. PS-11]KAJ8746562.1 hypothetical protein H9T68_00080 [Delftia sp. PS-11]
MPTPRTPPPFWHRLNSFFAFPLQPQPLGYALLLAFSSLLFKVLFFLPAPLSIALIEIGILLAASRYGFKVTALGAQGMARAADFPRELEPDWVHLPWKLFAILVVQATVAGWCLRMSQGLGQLALLAMSCMLPASIIVLVQTASLFAALNPMRSLETIRIIGKPYALLCFFLFLLSSGSQIAMTLLLPLFSGLILLPLFNFALIYFSWVMASLLGYVMYQHHEALGIEAVDSPDSVPGGAPALTPAQIARQQLDAEVAERLDSGDMAGALGLAYEDQRTRPDDAHAQRRYHRLLLLSDKTPTLLDHGRRFVALLLRQGQTSEALKVFKACRGKENTFALDDADQALALAQSAWRAGDMQATQALISGFDKRYKGHAAIPRAYELAARLMLQGFGRRDMAQGILAALEARYPDSEQTKEVRWLLRDQAAGSA